MIRNLLIAAVSSPNETQRNESLEILGNEFVLKTEPFINEIFTLLCSEDRTDHVISYSFLKKLIRQHQRGKLSDLNQYMEKSFIFWYEKERNRNTFDEIYSFQRQNIIQLNALYLSLNTSGKYRESFIDVVPFRICEFYTKGNKHELYVYLSYYGEVLKELDRYRIGNINSKKAAMGSVILLKVTTKLNPQNSLQASLWVNFSVNFSKFNSWIPDKTFLIKCLVQYSITKDSLMTLLEYLSTNFKIVWVLEDYCKILQGIEKIMYDCQNHIDQYKCKEVETILKCLRSFLHSFFTCNTKIQNSGDAMIAQYIYSYEQFEKSSLFLMNMIEYFSMNNEQESMGDLSHLIVEYSTQILRLYSTYLEENVIERYAKTFMNNFTKNPQYEKLFLFFSSLPKMVSLIFDWDQGVLQILNGNFELSEKYEPVYVNFLTHYINLNDYLDIDIANKLASFFFNLIQSRLNEIQQFDQFSGHQVPENLNKSIERVSLSIYGLSKMSKFRDFVDSNHDYFQTIVQAIFEIILKSSNDFSILIDSIHELIQQKKPEWNQIISQKALNYLVNIQNNYLKGQQMILYQIEIELYRIIKKTICLKLIFSRVQTLWINQNLVCNLEVANWTDLKFLVIVCNLDQKSEAVKEEILFLVEEILIQFNRISHEGKFQTIEPLLIEFSQKMITNLLFEELYRILEETTQIPCENFIQNNIFEKVQITTDEYAIVASGFSRQLHLSCIKIVLQLSLYKMYLQMIFMIISKLNSKYLLCVWEAVETLYPGKIQPILIPLNVKERLQKIRSGHLLDLFENLDLNRENMKMKETPSWYELYRNILRQDSVVIEIIHKKINEIVEN